MTNREELIQEAEALASTYGVERSADGDVVIRLGSAIPFECSPETAVKLACLLMKRAGMVVKLNQQSIIALYRGNSAH